MSHEWWRTILLLTPIPQQSSPSYQQERKTRPYPKIPHLPIQLNNLLHLRILRDPPHSLRHRRRRRHHQHPALDLKHMRVPHLALLGIQLLVQPRRHHIFDPDQPRVRVRRVVQQALSHFFVHVCAVVVRFRDYRRRVEVCVESVEVCADSLGRGEGLAVFVGGGWCFSWGVFVSGSFRGYGWERWSFSCSDWQCLGGGGDFVATCCRALTSSRLRFRGCFLWVIQARLWLDLLWGCFPLNVLFGFCLLGWFLLYNLTVCCLLALGDEESVCMCVCGMAIGSVICPHYYLPWTSWISSLAVERHVVVT